jgi:hypothetical protein
MSKEKIIAEIGKRIKSEYNKHSKSIPDWELIAAAKIWSMMSGEVTWRDEMAKIADNEYTLGERRAMVTQELFNKIYNGGSPNTMSHSELDQFGIPRYKTITTNQEVTWWGGNPDMNNTVTDENNTTGENDTVNRTTDENITTGNNHIPEQCSKHECLPYNPNKPLLDTMTFKFSQEANCVDGADHDIEKLIVEVKSSLGIDGDGGAFYVLRTEQWAFDEIDELIVMLRRVEAALNATNPTSIHVK